jgi:flagellin
MIGGINYASSQIASIYNSGSQQLAATLTKLASGKKFQNASDDLVNYLRAQNMESDVSGYEQVRENLTNFKANTAAAVAAGSSMYENLTEMKDLATKYTAAAGDTDLQAQYLSEFNSLRTQVATTLTSTYVDGVLITDDTAAANVEVDLDPDGTASLALAFSATVPTSAEITALDLSTGTLTADVQAEIDDVLTYLSEAKSFDGVVDQQINITNTVLNSKKAALSLITDIDEAEELNNATDQSIRQQAAMSMLAQANMSREAVLKLYM